VLDDIDTNDGTEWTCRSTALNSCNFFFFSVVRFSRFDFSKSDGRLTIIYQFCLASCLLSVFESREYLSSYPFLCVVLWDDLDQK
jgi:hypothetical protein